MTLEFQNGDDDTMDLSPLNAEQAFNEELETSLRENGYAVVVIRHDAAGTETQRVFAGHWPTAVADEVSRCAGRSNTFSEVIQYVRGERSSAQTDCFAKVGSRGVLGLPIEKRAMHMERAARRSQARE